jgi:FAD/FMN-containing dehydrogenase
MRNETMGQTFHGELIGPDDPTYDLQRRVWNGSIDRRPALIARCSDVADVRAALAHGRASGLPIAVRGGGHSFPGLSVCDDGIVIDLGPMKRIDVDAGARTARVQPGVLLGELDRATQAFGLAVPLGSVTHTGVAGLTLGGGFGWLMRKHGLAIDQLKSVELVTADGDVVRADGDEHADLFWAVRGGGGNFGIVTEFEFCLNSVGPLVLSGLLLWPMEQAASVSRSYRDWARTAPDELATALVMRRAPALETIPEALHGQPVVAVGVCWIGDPEDGEHVLDPIRTGAPALVDLVEARLYVDHQAMFDASFPHGIWIHSKAADVAALTDDVIDVLLEHAARTASPRSGIIAWQLGGAVGRVDELATPFGSRGCGYLVDILGATDGADGFTEQRDWARACWADLAPHQTGAYVNWMMDEGPDKVREAYGAERYARLRSIKRRYDPDNVFRLNQNIAPA